MINKIKKAAQGFTIIETLIAILLLTSAITGPITIAEKGLTTSLEARDQLTAFYLAQDAIEYVRYARDTNTLCASNNSCTHPSDWLAGNNTAQTINLTPCEGSGGCYLDSTNQSPTAPTACGTTCLVLSYESSGVYDYNSGTGTTAGTPRFVRTVTITPVASNSGEATVAVTVSWTEPTGQKKITVQEDIFNWQ